MVVPVKRDVARAFIREHHRHSGAPIGDVIRVGLAVDDELVAVAMAGRPVARLLDDGRTLEVLRVCTLGHDNACSRLYGALARAAKALGWKRLITYTLASEPGTSLRAAGFTVDHVRESPHPPSDWRTRHHHLGELGEAPVARIRWKRDL
jgi:hypothetical protein